VEYTPHDGDVTCCGCSAVQGKLLKMASVFLKEEKIYYKMVIHFAFKLSQSS